MSEREKERGREGGRVEERGEGEREYDTYRILHAVFFRVKILALNIGFKHP